MRKCLAPTIAAAVALLASRSADAIPFTFESLNRAIPDGNPVGLADTRQVITSISAIGDINVTVTITSRGGDAFNGDLYAYVRHGTSLAVLLNRVGRTSANELGYSDPGLNVTFDDEALADIHRYQSTVTLHLGGPLTGSWQPDGRLVDPDAVLDTSARAAGLNVFDGMNPNGDWTLFVADMEVGNMAQLSSWSLDFAPAAGPAVPELGDIRPVGAAVFALLFLIERRQRRLRTSARRGER